MPTIPAANNHEPITITDRDSQRQIVYGENRISKEALQTAFGMAEFILFTENGPKQLPVIPENQPVVYELQHGSKYFIGGNKQGSNLGKLPLYSKDKMQSVEADIRSNCTHLHPDLLIWLLTVSYCRVILQVSANNNQIPNRRLGDIELKELRSRFLKGAIEEIAKDIKACVDVENAGNRKIREHASFTIRFLKEWNQYVNIDKLQLDLTQLKNNVEDCFRETKTMTAELEKILKKVEELSQSLHNVSGCAEEERNLINARKHDKEQEAADCTARAKNVQQRQAAAEVECKKLHKEAEDLENWIQHPFHLFTNRMLDFFGSFLSTHIPCAQIDRMNVRAARHRERDGIETANNLQVEYNGIQRSLQEIGGYIDRLVTDGDQLELLIDTVTQLKKTLTAMEISWDNYRNYFENLLFFVNNMNQYLLSFISYNDNGIKATQAADRVLDLIGNCLTFIAAADVYDEVFERFAKPIMLHYETCQEHDNGIVNQEELLLLKEDNKRMAESFLRRNNPEVLKNAISQLREFAEPYKKLEE